MAVYFKLVEHYQYDAQRRHDLLAMLGIGAGSHAIIERLHREVIDDNVHAIVNGFYDKLLSHPEFQLYIESTVVAERLKFTLTDYLRQLGVACESEHYFEGRLRIGLVHERIGLPLPLYLSSFHFINTLILDLVPPAMKADSALFGQVLKLLSAVMMLDMNLAIEAYHYTEVAQLQTKVDSLRDEQRHLERRASRDALTGLANHERILQRLQEAVVTLYGRDNLCVVMADLDHFKHVNDTFGHQTGDAILHGVAERLRSSMRGPDMIGRYGGEEFLIILQNSNLKEGVEIAERLRQRIGASPLHHHDVSVHMTISLGITQYKPGDRVETLIERADRALYRAKREGRNRVVVEP